MRRISPPAPRLKGKERPSTAKRKRKKDRREKRPLSPSKGGGVSYFWGREKKHRMDRVINRRIGRIISGRTKETGEDA